MRPLRTVSLAAALAIACSAEAPGVETSAADVDAPPPPAYAHEAPSDVDAAAPTEVDAAAVIAIAATNDDACAFELLSRSLAPDADGLPRWSVSLMKTNVKASSCDGYQGTMTLTRSSYERPVGYVALVRETKKLVVTFDGQFEPGAVVYTRLVQVDYATGALMHEGEMVVQGTPLWPPAPALRPTSLDAAGRDVVLSGTGEFPGAGGGDTFAATFADFLGDEVQRPSPATSAVSD